MTCSYLALKDPQYDNFPKKLSVFLANVFLIMSCIVFVCNLSFMIFDDKNTDEEVVVNLVASDLVSQVLL